MKSKLLLTIILFLSFLFLLKAQNNDFKIGVVEWGNPCYSFDNIGNIVTTVKTNSEYSSIFGVLAEDGVNIIRTYEPTTDVNTGASGRTWGRNKQDLKDIITLLDNHDLQVMLYNEFWAKINKNNPSQILNDYNLDNNNTYFLNYDDVYNEVYQYEPFKSAIWGFNIIGENNPNSPYPFDGIRPPAWVWIWDNSGNYFGRALLPLNNANSAFSYFANKNTSYNLNLKLINAPGAHNQKIEGSYKADYLKMTNRGNVCYEAGYFPCQFNTYKDYSDRLLWKFENIDYCRKYFNEVHTELDVTFNSDPSCHRYRNSVNPDNPNFNHTWFKAYTSIIHGVNGVWFYDVHDMYTDNSSDQNRRTNLLNKDFSKSNFPLLYQNYLSHLIKELRYLVNKGFLSTNRNTVIYSKTSENDANGILPSCNTYIPQTLTYNNSKDLFIYHGWSSNYTHPNNNYTNEKFGLKYTIRTNGEEVIMIISNPNPVVIQNVPLNFNNVANPTLRNAKYVDILFEISQSVTSSTYKTVRNSNINLNSNSVGKHYTKSISNGILNLSFGPLDVHVIRFINNVPDHNNNWENVWTNHGSSWIEGWKIQNNDNYIPGDFDGDGVDELLCINLNTNGWVTLLDYYDNDWHWKWSTYGSSSAGTYIYNFRSNLTIGDFDGDGTDELLGVSSYGMRVFKFQNGNFIQKWYKGTSHAMWPYRDKFVAGDYNNDGKDEVFGIDNDGWLTVFHFNGSDWTWGWSNYGSHTSGTYIYNFKNNLSAGDFDGNGVDELFGVSSYGMRIFKFENGDFRQMWYKGTSHSLWPYSDDLIIGDYDNDGMDEVLGNDKDDNGWITMFNYNGSDMIWGWSCGSTVYLDDLYILENRNDTRFFPISIKKEAPDFLLAIRKYSSSYLSSLYMYLPDSYNIPGSTVGNSNDWPVSGSDGADKGHLIYLPDGGTITATTCNPETNYDTKIEIFNEDGTSTGAYNDDYSCGYNSLASTKTTTLNPGYYYVVVDGYGGATGNYKLTITIDYNLRNAPKENNEEIGNNMAYMKESIFIYPNPASNILNIVFPEESRYKIQIINMCGKIIKEVESELKEIQLDCNNLENGVYFINAKTDKALFNKKFIISR